MSERDPKARDRKTDYFNGKLEAWLKWLARIIVLPGIIVLILMWRDVEVIKSNRWSSTDQASFAAQMIDRLNEKANRDELPLPEVRQSLEMTQERLERLEAQNIRILQEIAAVREALRLHNQN